jgi:diaminopimelate epimerase
VTPFFKYTVCGNDFILVPSVGSSSKLSPAQLCCRRTGIGADQLVTIGDVRDGAHVTSIWNPDGSRSPFCGNAMLAVGAYLQECVGARAETLTINVDGLKVPFEVRQGLPTIGLPRREVKTIAASARKVASALSEMLVRCGTYHYVVVLDDLSAIDVVELGRRLENGARPGGTTNVIFTELASPREVRIVPWERGGSGATLACGSGAYSASAVAARLAGVTIADGATSDWTVRCPGGTLSISLGKIRGFLSGQPIRVYSGFI